MKSEGRRNPTHDGCLEFDLAYASGGIIKVKGGGWARTIRTPERGLGGDVEAQRYSPIDRCPFCNHRLDDGRHNGKR